MPPTTITQAFFISVDPRSSAFNVQPNCLKGSLKLPRVALSCPGSEWGRRICFPDKGPGPRLEGYHCRTVHVTCRSLLALSAFRGRLGCFHLGAITDNDSVHILVYVIC